MQRQWIAKLAVGLVLTTSAFAMPQQVEAQCGTLAAAQYFTGIGFTLSDCSPVSSSVRSWWLEKIEQVFDENDFGHSYCADMYEHGRSWVNSTLAQFDVNNSLDNTGNEFWAQAAWNSSGSPVYGLIREDWLSGNGDSINASLAAMHEGMHWVCEFGDSGDCAECETQPGKYDDECLTDMAADCSDLVQTAPAPEPLPVSLAFKRAQAAGNPVQSVSYAHVTRPRVVFAALIDRRIETQSVLGVSRSQSDSLAVDLIAAGIQHMKRLRGITDSTYSSEGIVAYDEVSLTLNLRISQQSRVIAEAGRRLGLEVVASSDAMYCETRTSKGVLKLLCGVRGVEIAYVPRIVEVVGGSAVVSVGWLGNSSETGGPGGPRGSYTLDLKRESEEWVLVDWMYITH